MLKLFNLNTTIKHHNTERGTIMKSKEVNFTSMTDTTRQIDNLATLLRMSAETGELFNTGDESIVVDTVTIIQEKTQELRASIEAAQAAMKATS